MTNYQVSYFRTDDRLTREDFTPELDFFDTLDEAVEFAAKKQQDGWLEVSITEMVDEAATETWTLDELVSA